MNQLVAGFLGKLIGSMGDQTPTANPVYGLDVDDDGNFVDKDGNFVATGGNSLQPYNSPSIGDTLFRPQKAEEANTANFNAENAPVVANQNRNISRGLQTKDLDTILGYLPDGIDNQSLVTLLGGNDSAQNLSSVRQSLSGMSLGLPENAAKTANETQLADYSQEANRLSNQNRLGALGTPSLEAGNQFGNDSNIALQNELTRENLSRQRANNQGVTSADALNAETNLEKARALYATPSVPLSQAATDAQSQYEVNTRPIVQEELQHEHDLAVGNRPYTDQSFRNNAIVSLAQSQHAPVEAPFSANVNSDGTMQVGHNPLGMSPMQMQMANMQGLQSSINGGMQTVTLPSGARVGIKTNPNPVVDPLNNTTVKPPIPVRPITPLQQDGPHFGETFGDEETPKAETPTMDEALDRIGVYVDNKGEIQIQPKREPSTSTDPFTDGGTRVVTRSPEELARIRKLAERTIALYKQNRLN